MTTSLTKAYSRIWTSESRLTPSSDKRADKIVLESSCECFDIEKVLSIYESQHSVEFGWYESKTRKVIIPSLNVASKDNLRFVLVGIKNRYVKVRGCNLAQIAYMLATARLEAYDFTRAIFFGPIAEKISYETAEVDYGVGPTARRPEYARKHGQKVSGDGYKYRGRGYVQITWRKNYDRFSEIAGADLVLEPDLATNRDVALKIMVSGMVGGLFTGKKLDDYINSSGVDYVNARRIINGLDKAQIIAEYAEKFESILVAAGCGYVK